MHAIAGFSSNYRHCNQAHHPMGFRTVGEGDENPPNHTLAALGVKRAPDRSPQAAGSWRQQPSWRRRAAQFLTAGSLA